MLVSFVVTVSIAVSAVLSVKGVEIPKIPRLVAHNGDNVLITCDIFASGNEIAWTFNGVNLVNGVKNSTELRRIITENGKLLLVKNAQPDDSGIYRCEDETGRLTHSKHLDVGRLPDRPSNLTCVTRHSLDTMTCCWDVGKYSGIPMNFSMTYVSRTKTTFSWAPRGLHDETVVRGGCVKNETKGHSFGELLSERCCDLPVTDPGTNHPHQINEFVFQLISENALGKKMSPNISERPLAWIKPSPPLNAKLTVAKQAKFYNLLVTWSKPNMTIDNFEYRVRYRILGPSESKWNVQRRILKNHYEFELMRSHSTVEVQVAAWPTGMYGGYWSEWSKSAFNRTGESLPMSNLQYKTIVVEKDNNGREIELEWFPYGRPDEPGFHILLSVQDCKRGILKRVNVSAYESKYRLENVISDCVEVSAAFCNNGGCSEKEKKIVQPHTETKFTVDVGMAVADDGYIVNWKPLNGSAQIMTKTCLVKILGFERTTENPNHSTQQTVMEKLVPCRQKKVTFHTEPSPCLDYISSVSSWEKEDVIYMETSVSDKVAPPKPHIMSLKSFRADSRNAKQLNILWSRYDDTCAHLQPRLFYSPTSGAECRNNATCHTQYLSEVIDCNATKASLTSDIFGHTTYDVKYAMCCPTTAMAQKPLCFFPGPSAVATVTTPIGEPSAPVNIRWKDLDVLSWDTPMHANGPLSGYHITIDGDSEDIPEINMTTINPSVNLSGICGTEYNATLQIKIYARNQNELGETLLGTPASSGIKCTAEKVIPRQSIAVIIGIVISTIVVVFAAVLAYCQKERIKAISRKRFWPRLPRPSVIVTMQVTETNADTANTQLLDSGRSELHDDQATLLNEERCDDIRMQPTPTDSTPLAPTVPQDGAEATGKNVDDSEEEIDLMLFQDDIAGQEQSEILSSRPRSFSESGRAFSGHLFPAEHEGTTTDRRIPNAMTSTPNSHGGPPRRVEEPVRASTCGSNLTSTTPTRDHGVIRPSNTTQTQARSPGSENYLSSAPTSGSTPSLRSYLACSNYTDCSNQRPPGFMYAGISNSYQWTLPEYTFTSSLYGPGSISFPNYSSGIGQNIPFSEDGRITFSIGDGTIEASIQMNDFL